MALTVKELEAEIGKMKETADKDSKRIKNLEEIIARKELVITDNEKQILYLKRAGRVRG